MNDLEVKKPLQKLHKYIDQGIGSLMIPKSVKKILKQQAQGMEMISEVESYDVSLPVQIGEQNEDTIFTTELAQRTYSRFLYQETKKQINVESILHNAYNELENEEKVSENDVDEDWINRFFNSIGDIGNVDMQILWGKILAGEVKNPNSFSLRTLDKVKSLSQNEAIIFTNLCSYVFSIGSTLGIINEDSIKKQHGINFSEILKMDECGLIDSSSLISITVNTDDERLFLYGTKIAMLTDNREGTGRNIAIQLYKLTATGAELFKILQITYNYVYFANLMRKIIEGKEYLKYTIHNVIKFDDDGAITYFKEPCPTISDIVNEE